MMRLSDCPLVIPSKSRMLETRQNASDKCRTRLLSLRGDQPCRHLLAPMWLIMQCNVRLTSSLICNRAVRHHAAPLLKSPSFIQNLGRQPL